MSSHIGPGLSESRQKRKLRLKTTRGRPARVRAPEVSAEAEAQRQHADVTICTVEESGNLLFLENRRRARSTIQWAQKKAHAAFYQSPPRRMHKTQSREASRGASLSRFFPNQGGLPILADGQILGGIAASGAKSEIDEAIAQAGLDAVSKK